MNEDARATVARQWRAAAAGDDEDSLVDVRQGERSARRRGWALAGDQLVALVELHEDEVARRGGLARLGCSQRGPQLLGLLAQPLVQLFEPAQVALVPLGQLREIPFSVLRHL